MKRFWSLVILSFVSLAVVACAGQIGLQDGPPRAVDGVLDLRGWDFAQDGAVRLDGEWGFYWQRLLTAEDLAGAGVQPPDGLLRMPGTWRGEIFSGQPLPGTGHATLRLSVLLDDAVAEQILAVQLPSLVLTTHRLFANGQVIGSVGKVGADPETAVPGVQGYAVAFVPGGERLELILQIANYDDVRGGLLDSIWLGDQERIARNRLQKLGRNLFVSGGLLVMGLYHLGLFGIRRREQALLYFGSFCVLIAAGVLITEQALFFSGWGRADWSSYLRARQLLPVPAMLFLTLFVQALFPQEANPWAVRLLRPAALVATLLVLALPTVFVSGLVPLFAGVVAVVGLYCLGLVALAAGRRRPNARVVLAGFLPLLAAILNDILYYTVGAPTRPLLQEGLLLFTLAQAYLLAKRFGLSFARIEHLSTDLQRKNRSLVQAQAELRRSEAHYRSIFEDSQDVIFLAGLDGQIQTVNPACEEVLVYTPEQMQEMNVRQLLVEPAAFAPLQQALLRDGSLAEHPLAVQRKDGRELACQLTATVRRDEAGEPLGFQGILHDVTAYQQAEAQRQRSLALQRLNQSLERRLEERTADLSDANAALQAEIAQRQMHQQEKDRLLALAQQQSEHLRSLSQWLSDVQTSASGGGQPAEIEQTLTTIRQNLNVLQNATILEQDPELLIQITDTVRLLAEMELYIEQVASAQSSSPALDDPLADSPLLLLSSRERQVLKLMAEGKSNPEIADLLTVRLNTVHTYLKRIRTKLEIQDTPGLIDFARRYGLIE